MIFLIRHSQAVSADYKTRDDSRWLTEAGRALAIEAGRALAQQETIDCIVSSPCCRAVQTAELVAQVLGYQGEIAILESLRSEASPQMAVEELKQLPFAVVLATSHEPIVSTMSLLLSGQSPAVRQQGFRTAEIRCHSEGTQSWQWRG